jgi:hypothetical protein
VVERAVVERAVVAHTFEQIQIADIGHSLRPARSHRQKQVTVASKAEAARVREHMKEGQNAYVDVLKAYSDSIANMTERSRYRHEGGAMSVHSNTRQAELDFQEAARCGHLTVSPTNVQQMENGLWMMRSDRQLIPNKPMTCGLWSLFSVTGMSARELGVDRDPYVTNNQEVMGFNQLGGLLERAKSEKSYDLAPAAALTLVPVLYLAGDGWRVLNEDDGLFILTAWIKRGATSKSHFIALNAGTSVIHLGPWREVLSRDDKADPEMYAAQVRLAYGIYLTETCVVRRLMVNPRHPLCHRLSFNVPAQFAALPAESHSRRARKRKRKKACMGGSAAPETGAGKVEGDGSESDGELIVSSCGANT